MNEAQLAKAMRDNPELAELNPPAQPKRSRVLVPLEHTLNIDAFFKSNTEADSLDFLKAAYDYTILLYDPLTLVLPGGRYTPDWFMKLSNGLVIMIEVKPENWRKFQKSARGAARALREAVYFYSESMGWEWWMLLKGKDGFHIKTLKEVSP